MKKIASTVYSIFLFFITCSFQISGSTHDGREVLLESDGSWKFSNAKKYTKSLLATRSIESRIVPFKISYNPAQWTCKLGEDYQEYLFTLKNDNECGALLIPEVLSLPWDMSKDLLIQAATSAGGELNMRVEEDRIVNGIPIKYFVYDLNDEGFEFTYMVYVYAGENATVQFAGYSSKNDFPKYKNTLEDLLNGLALSNRLTMDSKKN